MGFKQDTIKDINQLHERIKGLTDRHNALDERLGKTAANLADDVDAGIIENRGGISRLNDRIETLDARLELLETATLTGVKGLRGADGYEDWSTPDVTCTHGSKTSSEIIADNEKDFREAVREKQQQVAAEFQATHRRIRDRIAANVLGIPEPAPEPLTPRPGDVWWNGRGKFVYEVFLDRNKNPWDQTEFVRYSTPNLKISHDNNYYGHEKYEWDYPRLDTLGRRGDVLLVRDGQLVAGA